MTGIFIGTITITAEAPTPDMRRMMTERQINMLEATRGCIVSVVFNGQCDPQGLGIAFGAALRSMVSKVAERAGVTEEEAAAIMVPAVLETMTTYAGIAETLHGGAIQ